MTLNRTQIYEVLQDAFNRSYPGDGQATLGALANLLTPVWDGSVSYSVKSSLFDGGASGDGQTSDRDAIQAAIDWSSSNRQTVFIPDGTYVIDRPLYARDYATIIASPNAVLTRTFSQQGTSGLLMNENMNVQVKQFRWTGGVLQNLGTLVRDGSVPYEPGIWTGASLPGNTVCLNGDAATELADMFIDEWAARAFLLFGDLKLRDCRAISVQDGGGIRYAGWGREFRAIGCHVVCGDDVLQFVPAGGTGAVGFDEDTIGGQYIGCTGYSWNARFMAAILLNTSETLHMTNSIRDCGWLGCHGRANGRALTIENEDSTGKISGITVTDCSVEITGSTTTFAAIGIIANTGTGGVEDVSLRGFRIKNPVQEALKIDSTDVRSVHAIDCVFGKPRTSAVNCVQITRATDVTFRGCHFSGNGAHVALVGSGNVATYGVDFDSCRFDEIDNTLAGVRFTACVGGLVRRATFVQRSGQTTARGISLGAAADVQRVVLEGPHDDRGLTLAEYINAFTNNGTSGNAIVRPPAITADGTNRVLRNHECGLTFINSGASALVVYTLPAAITGLFYSAVVADADGLRFLASGTDRVRNLATLGAAGGSITSTTIGDSITLRCVAAGEWWAMPATGTWVVA